MSDTAGQPSTDRRPVDGPSYDNMQVCMFSRLGAVARPAGATWASHGNAAAELLDEVAEEVAGLLGSRTCFCFLPTEVQLAAHASCPLVPRDQTSAAWLDRARREGARR